MEGIETNLAFHAICPNVLVLERFTPYYRAAIVRTSATQYGKKAKLMRGMRGMESDPTGSTPIDKHLRADLHAEEANMGDVESPYASVGFVRAPTTSLKTF